MFKTPDAKSKSSLAASSTLLGSDPLLEQMKAQGIPLTRQNYLEKADLKEPLTAEQEWLLPLELSRVVEPSSKET